MVNIRPAMTDKIYDMLVEYIESEADRQRVMVEIELLRVVADAARGIALRDSPTHQQLREALEALDRDNCH